MSLRPKCILHHWSGRQVPQGTKNHRFEVNNVSQNHLKGRSPTRIYACVYAGVVCSGKEIFHVPMIENAGTILHQKT